MTAAANLASHAIELPAKSQRSGELRALSLEQHLLDTEGAAALLFDESHRFGQNYCRFFKLAKEEQRKFLLHVRIGGLLHDLGKANEDFVRLVTRGGQQTLRHEHLSALILHHPQVRNWLRQSREVDWDIVTAAVLSHHFKANRLGKHQWGQPQNEQERVRLYLGHPQVKAALQRLAELAKLPSPPPLQDVDWRVDDVWKRAQEDGRRAADLLELDIIGDDANQTRRALLAATKAGVVAADAAASGLVPAGHDIQGWIREICAQPAITSDEIDDKILKPRIAAITGRSTGPFKLHTFQQQVAEQGPRVLLLAGCGMGKTLAAWKWAETQTRSHAFSKVLFLYPTRGTATEGFRDYVSWAPEADAALMHGTARYELEEIRRNPSESTRDKDFEPEARLFALGLWSKRFFSSTVDQFLSFLENQYAAVCLLPALTDSIVIIDEVHSFDRHMFELLVTFLRTFDIPVLCMTATLPASRRETLESAGLQVYPRAEHRIELHDLNLKEQAGRYRLEPLSGSSAAMHSALAAYRSGQRVLWVVNQVRRCQELARQLAQDLGQTVLCYHSRFCLRDRQTKHKDTVSAFAFSRTSPGPAIAVTTQVCEMSLDLDADVLITEWAPVTSLVQRFGRANRHGNRGDGFRAVLHTYEPADNQPYAQEEMAAASAFLAELSTGDVSQARLAEALERHGLREAKPDNSARFLDGGYYAVPGSFRDGEELGAASVLDGELLEIKSHLSARRPIDGFVVTVPKRFARRAEPSAAESWLPRHLSIAASAQYDKCLGFLADLERTP